MSAPKSSVVDTSSKESFPASDPPSWAMGRDSAPEPANVLLKSKDIDDVNSGTHAQAKAISNLNGEVVAILVGDTVDQEDLKLLRKALEEEGAVTEMISPHAEDVSTWHDSKQKDAVAVNVELKAADPDRYIGLLLLGETFRPDLLRANERAVKMVRAFYSAKRPIAAVGHAVSMLSEIGPLYGHKITSCPSVRTDIRNAGGCWVNEPIVVDHGLITCQASKDIAGLTKAFIRELITLKLHRVNVGPGEV